jgi:protein gp37
MNYLEAIMAESKIEWTEKTWNPITGCTKISEGCRNCYAEPMANRLQAMGQIKYTHGFEKVVCHEKALEEPLKWKKPCKIFVCSMADLFHDDVPFDFIAKIFETMEKCPQHTFIVLTKRPERMVEFIGGTSGAGLSAPPLPNVWFGVTAENQEQADKRIPILLQIPAAKRFVSIEPMLGPIDLTDLAEDFPGKGHTDEDIQGGGGHMDALYYDGNPIDDPRYEGATLDWVIVGGESGKNARPIHPNWVKTIRDQCNTEDIPFFFKQWGEWKTEYREGTKVDMEYLKDNQTVAMGDGKTNHVLYTRVGKKKAGRLLDGKEYSEAPE